MGISGQIDAVVAAVTGNVVVRRVLGVMSIADQAGASLFSASLAFNTMFAVIPLVLLLAGVLGWLIEDPVERQALLEQLIGYFPPLADFFQSSLDQVVHARGALSLIGILGLVWGASNFYGGLDEVMRRIFTGGVIRGQVSRRLRGIVTVVVLVVVIIGTVSLSGLWALIDKLVGGLEIWRYAVPVLVLAIMSVVVLGVFKLVPTAPPSIRAALPPAIVAGVGIGLLTNLFSLIAPWVIGGLSGFGVVATVFAALIWLNFSYQILLYGAAWACLRRNHEAEERAALAS